MALIRDNIFLAPVLKEVEEAERQEEYEEWARDNVKEWRVRGIMDKMRANAIGRSQIEFVENEERRAELDAPMRGVVAKCERFTLRHGEETPQR